MTTASTRIACGETALLAGLATALGAVAPVGAQLSPSRWPMLCPASASCCASRIR
jgi:hypothetical protein